MRLEENIALAIRSGKSLGFDESEGFAVGGFEEPHGHTMYPPPGYLPWDVLEVGNGDTYGFYWPIGKEDQPPIVCTLMHDARLLFPMTSTFERALRLLRATEIADEEELKDLAKAFGIKLTKLPRTEPDEKVPFFNVRGSDLMKFDDASPSILLAAAREMRGKDLAGAEKLALRAVEILPEYADGWELLANLNRQARNEQAAVDYTLQALTAPISFGARDRKKMISSLKKLPDTAASNPNHPVWKRRKEIAFADDARESSDARLLGEAIEEFHAQGEHLRAIYLRIVLGEWMSTQTVSFQERAAWKWPEYYATLAQDHEIAGLKARLPALSG